MHQHIKYFDGNKYNRKKKYIKDRSIGKIYKQPVTKDFMQQLTF